MSLQLPFCFISLPALMARLFGVAALVASSDGVRMHMDDDTAVADAQYAFVFQDPCTLLLILCCMQLSAYDCGCLHCCLPAHCCCHKSRQQVLLDLHHFAVSHVAVVVHLLHCPFSNHFAGSVAVAEGMLTSVVAI